MANDYDYGGDGTSEPAGSPVRPGDGYAPPDPSTEAFIGEWCKKIKDARRYWASSFKIIREDMYLARHGGTREWCADDQNYVVPITNRHINLAVSQIYARNPTVAAKRKRRLLNTVWDGSAETLAMAQQQMEMLMQAGAAGMEVDPAAAAGPQAIIADAQNVVAQNEMLDRTAKTTEILVQYYLDEQSANYKKQLKQAVLRAKTCGVAYAKVGYQRLLRKNPEVTGKIEDATDKISTLQMLIDKASREEFDEYSSQMEQLKLLLDDLKDKEDLIAREGFTIDFPATTTIIPDPCCKHLGTFAGGGWIAHEFHKTEDEILKIYKVDIKAGGYSAYKDDARSGNGKTYGEQYDAKRICVWEVQNKDTGQFFTIADGYCHYLQPPADPEIKIERFWTLIPLIFNETESEEEKELYPISDVHGMRWAQMEYNTARQGLREHRLANRPGYVTGGDRMDPADRARLAGHAPNEVVVLKALLAGEKIEDILQRLPVVPIDPAQYEVNGPYEDIQRAVGSQEANFGSLSGATATEAGIAEGSRMSTTSANVDTLDAWLSEIVRAAGQICLLNVSKETVLEIVGPGAVWPDMPPTREDVNAEIFLEIRAGSSGRPNAQAELAKLERAMPTLVQIPGVSPVPLIRKYAELLEIPIDEIYAPGMLSITAQNAMASKLAAAAQPGTGDPETDPASQGDEGGDNAPAPAENEPGPQPAFPTA